MVWKQSEWKIRRLHLQMCLWRRHVRCKFFCATLKANPMCQPRSQPSPLRIRHYLPASIPTGLSDNEVAHGSCSKPVPRVKTKTFLCSSEPNNHCVSLYFNKAKEECLLVFHTDATINMGNAAGWKKLTKEN